MMIGSLIEVKSAYNQKRQFKARDYLRVLDRCQQVCLLATGQLTDDIEELASQNQIKLKDLEDYIVQIRLIGSQLVQHMAIAQTKGLKSYILLAAIPSSSERSYQSQLFESLNLSTLEPSNGAYDGETFVPPDGYF
jgi:hypothetical protein